MKANRVLFGLAILSIAIVLFMNIFLADKPALEPLATKTIPLADEIVLLEENPTVYAGKKNGEIIGYAVVAKATGYQSDIEVMTGIDGEGKVIDTIIVDHQETPSFFRRLTDSDRFWEQFVERDITEGFYLEENIDGVSGATVSAKAIAQAVHTGTNNVGRNYLDLEMPPLDVKVDFGFKEISIISLMAMALFATYKRKTKYRIYALAFSALVLGFWYNAFVIYAAFGSIITGQIPYPPENLAWHILVCGALLLILATGKNLFCYWVCPFGASQEILGKIGGGNYHPSAKIKKYAKYLPGFFAWFAMILALLAGEPSAAAYEPYGTFFAQVGTSIQWVLLPLVVLASLFVFRFWCNYFCPVGYVLSLTVQLRTKGVRLWKNRTDKKQPGKTIPS